MANSGLTVKVHITGARETLAAFRDLPKQASDELRKRTLKLSQALADQVTEAARADSAQSALLAPTVKARRDRVPVIQAGGTRRVGRHRVPSWAVLFGAEFGANTRFGWYAKPKYQAGKGRQYREHRRRHSYWFFRTVFDAQADMDRAWNQVADEVQAAFGQDR